MLNLKWEATAKDIEPEIMEYSVTHAVKIAFPETTRWHLRSHKSWMNLWQRDTTKCADEENEMSPQTT